jgi:hypothetical protein
MRSEHHGLATPRRDLREARKGEKYLSFLRASVATLIVVVSISCRREPEPSSVSDLPKQFQDIENVIRIAPVDGVVPDTVELIREKIFESNSDVFIEGYIRNIAVDEKERVFIASTRQGSIGIYVFNPDGSFVTKFLREGRGPGEYESLSSLNIVGDKLYVFDTRLQKIGIFSMDGFKHIRDILIDQSLLKENDEFNLERMIANKLIVRKDGSFIIRLKSRPWNDPLFQPKEIYLQADANGRLLPSPNLIVDSHTYYFPDGQFELPFPAPFNRSSLVAVGDDGTFYSNWTDKFRINIHNSEANLLRSLFSPYENADLNLSELNFDRNMEETLHKYELPNTWPAVHTMELDDEGRLWVATIMDSEKEFTWYVFNRDGDLLARFTKPGERSKRIVALRPKIVIKNGFFYSHERDMRQGIDRIIKYRIDFREAR